MKRNHTRTPRSQVKHYLRLLWLRSRERAAALKRDGYSCQECGVKQSTRKGHECKVEVHHLHPDGTDMDAAIDYIYRRILCPPEELVTLCPDCHEKTHKGEI